MSANRIGAAQPVSMEACLFARCCTARVSSGFRMLVGRYGLADAWIPLKFHYANLSLAELGSTDTKADTIYLGIFPGEGRLISFQGWSGSQSKWHGTWSLEGATLFLQFDYKGRDLQKTATLVTTDTSLRPREFRGYDYRGREIRMHFTTAFHLFQGRWEPITNQDVSDILYEHEWILL